MKMSHLQFEIISSEDNNEKSEFSGSKFYEHHCKDLFLQNAKLVLQIIRNGGSLRNAWKQLPPGEYMVLKGYQVSETEPLKVYKGHANLQGFDYTLSSLQGMCAAFIYKNKELFDEPLSPVAVSLGLQYNPKSDVARQAYLSTIPGAYHFPDIFSYWPAAIVHYQIRRNKMKLEKCEHILNVKNNQGQCVAEALLEPAIRKLVDDQIEELTLDPLIKEIVELASMLWGSKN